MKVSDYEVNVIELPEGEVQFITAAVLSVRTGVVIPTNLVTGSEYPIDWDYASPQLLQFSGTVLLWGNSPESIENGLEQLGYSLVDESDGNLATEEFVMSLLED